MDLGALALPIEDGELVGDRIRAQPVHLHDAVQGANIALSLLLFPFLQHVGIALATTLAAWLNAGLLALSLRRREHHQLDARFKGRLPRIILASVLMGAIIWALGGWVAPWFDGAIHTKIAGLIILVGAGLGSFAAFAVLFGAARISEFRVLLRRPKSGGEGKSP